MSVQHIVQKQAGKPCAAVLPACFNFNSARHYLGTYSDSLAANTAVIHFREKTINPFLLEKMVGIQEEAGGYRPFLGKTDLGLF